MGRTKVRYSLGGATSDLRLIELRFGGTSVGKFALPIAGIVKSGLLQSRIAVVCSARSSYDKASGTTNRCVLTAIGYWLAVLLMFSG